MTGKLRLPPLPVFLFFLLAALLAYGQALDNPLLFDDRVLLEGNENLSWGNVPDLFTKDYFQLFGEAPVGYRPLSTFTYIVNRELWGENFALWRLFYLCWHALNALLLFLLLRRRLPAAPSFFAGAFFLLHPLHSETINQISYNEDIMAAGFLLLASIFFLDYVERGRAPSKGASVLSLLFALLSKETALFYPLVPAAWVLCTRGPAGGGEGKRAREALAALGAAAAAYGGLALLLWRNPAEHRQLDWSMKALAESLPGTMAIFRDFLVRFFRPLDLSAVYEYGGTGWGSPAALGGIAALLLMAGLVAAGLKTSRAALSVPGVWYLSGLAPLGYSLLYPSASYAYDHYLYGPSIGLTGYLVLALAAAGVKGDGSPRRLAPWLVLPLCLPLFFVVVQGRNAVWSSDLGLWEDALSKAPGSLHARYNYAFSLHRAGRTGEAAEQYRAVLQAEPRYSPAWYNLGRIALAAGRTGEGEEDFRRAVESDPGNADALVALGELSAGRGGTEGAEELFLAALAAQPGYARPVEALADLYFAGGRDGEAEVLYTSLVEAQSGYAKGWYRLGVMALRRGDAGEAADHFGRALDADPDHAGASEGLEKAGVLTRKGP